MANQTTLINGYEFIPYQAKIVSPKNMLQASSTFFEEMNGRRSIREFSSRAIPIEVVNNILRTASTAPSGAHKQPWSFCVVSNPELKKQIREAAEKEEFESYHTRMSDDWLADLQPLQTDWRKPFLETAPYLIVVFKRIFEFAADGSKKNNYYVNESVGIACGMLLAAAHHAGLVALTHTPSPMNFLSKLLNRPENERPFLLIPIGFAADNALVPNLHRKDLSEIATYY